MQKSLLSAAGLLAITLLVGCGSAKSPATLSNDVAAAEQKSATDIADAQKKASQDNARASAKVDNEKTDLNNTEARGAYDIAIKDAEGIHRVSLEKCTAFDGDPEKKCKDQADADYDAAKANARVAQVSTTR